MKPGQGTARRPVEAGAQPRRPTRTPSCRVALPLRREPYAAAAASAAHDRPHAADCERRARARDAECVWSLRLFYYNFEARHESIHHTVFTPGRALAKWRERRQAASPAAWRGRLRAQLLRLRRASSCSFVRASSLASLASLLSSLRSLAPRDRAQLVGRGQAPLGCVVRPAERTEVSATSGRSAQIAAAIARLCG